MQLVSAFPRAALTLGTRLAALNPKNNQHRQNCPVIVRMLTKIVSNLELQTLSHNTQL